MMKRLIAYSCMAIFAMGSMAQNQKDEAQMNRFISGLMKKMTLEEKVGQLSQCSGGFATGPDNTRISRTEDISKGLIGSLLNVSGAANTRKYQEAAMKSRLQIPLLFGLDVIHGYRTGFPLPLAEAVSFDLDAIERGLRCAAKEAAAARLHWTFAPMVDISRDAWWGRVMEGAGEDPYYGSLVAKARVHGLQGDDLSKENTILSCIKHFAGYGAAIAGKDYNSVDMSMGQFANFYMPPYKAGAEAGAATFMSAFNDFNNEPSTGSTFLLRELLKNQWGFKGFVVSDWGSVGEMMNHRYAKDEKEAAYKGIKAGLDMEMVSECYSKNLVSLVKEGKVSIKLVDDAVRRILEQKYKLGLFDDPFRYCDEERERTVIGSQESRKEACYVSERSIVLLKNENSVLPLSSSIKKVALIGALSKSQKDMCGAWSCAEVGKVVTLYEAMEKRGVDINYNDGYDLKTNKIVNLDQTLAAARQSDVVIVAMGEQAWESGEMRSKGDISIAAEQQRLVSELVKTGKPVVVLMMCGRPVIFNEVRREAPAILCTWWLGSEAGNAICNVLWGDYNPSGRLPVTVYKSLEQLPGFEDYGMQGRTYRYFSGDPLYEFGYGLSYTSFRYTNLQIPTRIATNDPIEFSVDVTNTGNMDGDEVVQVYISHESLPFVTPICLLKGFKRVSLKKGETKTICFLLESDDLSVVKDDGRVIVMPCTIKMSVGGKQPDMQSLKQGTVVEKNVDLVGEPVNL